MSIVEYLKNKSAFSTTPSSNNLSINKASSTTDGLMSSQDKLKLDNLSNNSPNTGNDDFNVDLLSYYNAAKL